MRELTWKKVGKGKSRSPNQKICTLCDKESLFILRKNKLALNTRKELGGYCPHRRKYFLKNIKSNDQVRKDELAKKKANKEHYNKRKKTKKT